MAEERTGTEVKETYKYIAFISYRHLHPDIEIAKAIHTMVETFKLPKEFIKDNGPGGLRVFRDREELSTSSLSNSIQDALKNSKYLIVICSERFRESVWCNIEVETFIRLHGIHRVIPVLIEGEPHESFPPALLSDTDEIDLDAEEKKDILAAELRSEEVRSPSFVGFRELEKSDPEKVKELGNKAIKLLKDEKYRIMAGILGVSYGDLKQREKVRRQKRIIFLSSVISLSLLFFGLFMLRAYMNENKAKRQTIQDKSYFMLEEAERLIDQGDRFKALIISENAMAEMDNKMEKFNDLKARHLSIMNRSLDSLKTGAGRVIETNNRFTFMDINKKNDAFVAGYGNDSIGVWDTATGNLKVSARGHSQQVKIVHYSEDDKKIVSGGFDDVINIWDADTLKILRSVKAEGNIMFVEFSDDDRYLNVIYDSTDAYVYQKYNAETLTPEGRSLKLRRNIKRVAFDEKSEKLWVIYDTYTKDSSFYKYDLKEGKEIKRYKDLETIMPIDGGTKDLTTPYNDLRMMSDGELMFLRTGTRLVRIDPETDKDIFQVDGLLGGLSGDLLIGHKKGDSFFYIADGLNLIKVDAATGAKVKEIPIPYSAIDLSMSEDGSMMAVLGNNGSISIIRDDMVSEVIRNNSAGGSEYLYMTSDGKHLMELSLKNQQIRLTSLQDKSGSLLRDGQIVTVSRNRRFALINRDGKLFITDTENDKEIRAVESEYIIDHKAYVRDGMGYVISGDGRYLSGFSTEKDQATGKDTVFIFVLDTVENKVVIKNRTDLVTFFTGFSYDSSVFFMNSAKDEVTLYDMKTFKEIRRVRFDKGNIGSIRLSDDMKLLAVNYVEGIANVYSIENNEKKAEIPGSIISMETQGNDSYIRSIYNNTGSVYKNFKKEGNDVNLGKSVDLSGDDLTTSDSYYPEKHMLVSIRSQKDDHTAYLIDFRTGDLIQTFTFRNNAYKMKAFISEKGNYLISDSYYGFEKKSSNDFSYYTKYERYPIMSYESLSELSRKVTEKIQLSDTEKKELNIR